MSDDLKKTKLQYTTQHHLLCFYEYVVQLGEQKWQCFFDNCFNACMSGMYLYLMLYNKAKTHFFVMTTHTCTQIIARVTKLTGWASILHADCLCSKGSVVVLVKAPFDTTTGNDMVTKTRIEDVLSAAVKSHELPVPKGETFVPLKTVASALPQVAKIPTTGTFSLHQGHNWTYLKK